jgi:hypothetical protein
MVKHECLSCIATPHGPLRQVLETATEFLELSRRLEALMFVCVVACLAENRLSTMLTLFEKCGFTEVMLPAVFLEESALFHIP